MKKVLILIMFFSVLSYSAGLKSGLYITDEPQFDSLMINYNSYGDLKVFKDGKTVFLSVKLWRDTGIGKREIQGCIFWNYKIRVTGHITEKII